jgi:hypothetical protein
LSRHDRVVRFGDEVGTNRYAVKIRGGEPGCLQFAALSYGLTAVKAAQGAESQAISAAPLLPERAVQNNLFGLAEFIKVTIPLVLSAGILCHR